MEQQQEAIATNRLNAVKLIQSVVRMFVYKRRALRKAQLVYMKYIDPKEKREYWFNPKTMASMWTKPRLLGHLDCGMPIMLPTAKEEFVVLCNICLTKTSTCFCDECNEPMCNQCFVDYHKAGQRNLHTRIDLTTCVQCEYQIGSHYCCLCDDSYCDTCFKYRC